MSCWSLETGQGCQKNVDVQEPLVLYFVFFFWRNGSPTHTSSLVCCVDRCRKLPRALKDWQAFKDLKQRIDDFSETCPLLELMANKAMKERHWDRITKCTGHAFNLESENFVLRNIMEAPLLPHKEDIEVTESVMWAGQG